MQNEMEFLGDGTPPLQCPAQQSGQVHSQPRLVQSGSFERSLMIARHDPGFIGDARGIRTESQVVPASFEDAHSLTLFLLKDVAEDAAILDDEVFAAGAP